MASKDRQGRIGSIGATIRLHPTIHGAEIQVRNYRPGSMRATWRVYAVHPWFPDAEAHFDALLKQSAFDGRA